MIKFYNTAYLFCYRSYADSVYFLGLHISWYFSILITKPIYLNYLSSLYCFNQSKSQSLWAAHSWIVDFCLCDKTSFCARAKLLVWKCTSPVRSYSWKSSHFHVKCFPWSFSLKLERGQGNKHLRGGSKACIWAKWPIRLPGSHSGFCSVTRSISTTSSPLMGCWSIAWLRAPHNIIFAST